MCRCKWRVIREEELEMGLGRGIVEEELRRGIGEVDFARGIVVEASSVLLS